MTENNTTQQTAPTETRAESPAENSVENIAENTAEITEALRAEYAELTDKIRAARRAYYNEDAPFLSDAEYDALYRRLEIIEAEHPHLIANDSPTQEVGGEAIEAFAPVTHLQRMYSLEDVFSFEELRTWLTKTEESSVR